MQDGSRAHRKTQNYWRLFSSKTEMVNGSREARTRGERVTLSPGQEVESSRRNEPSVAVQKFIVVHGTRLIAGGVFADDNNE